MDDLIMTALSMKSVNIENAAQVKVLKGANEQLETVVGTLINSIPNFSEITGKGGLIDIEAWKQINLKFVKYPIIQLNTLSILSSIRRLSLKLTYFI